MIFQRETYENIAQPIPRGIHSTEGTITIEVLRFNRSLEADDLTITFKKEKWYRTRKETYMASLEDLDHVKHGNEIILILPSPVVFYLEQKKGTEESVAIELTVGSGRSRRRVLYKRYPIDVFL